MYAETSFPAVTIDWYWPAPTYAICSEERPLFAISTAKGMATEHIREVVNQYWSSMPGNPQACNSELDFKRGSPWIVFNLHLWSDNGTFSPCDDFLDYMQYFKASFIGRTSIATSSDEYSSAGNSGKPKETRKYRCFTRQCCNIDGMIPSP